MQPFLSIDDGIDWIVRNADGPVEVYVLDSHNEVCVLGGMPRYANMEYAVCAVHAVVTGMWIFW